MLDEFLASQKVTHLLRQMAKRNCGPKNLQITPVADGFFASVFDDDVDEIISEQVCMGFAKTASLSTLKGLVERLERAAFIEGSANGRPSCQTKRSDGFAGFPTYLNRASAIKTRARANAYNEALERFVWAKWWDDIEVGHDRIKIDALCGPAGLTLRLLNAAREQLPISGFEVIRPHVESPSDQPTLGIIVAHLTNSGSVTGGAAGNFSDSLLWERAASELFRHCLALNRLFDSGGSGNNFYQKRLHFFGSGAGYTLVQERLEARGTKRISLPNLKFDEEVVYAHSDLVYVHRCLFDNQPPFIGGSLDRLCI